MTLPLSTHYTHLTLSRKDANKLKGMIVIITIIHFLVFSATTTKNCRSFLSINLSQQRLFGSSFNYATNKETKNLKKNKNNCRFLRVFLSNNKSFPIKNIFCSNFFLCWLPALKPDQSIDVTDETVTSR